jgi:hypothetical protein
MIAEDWTPFGPAVTGDVVVVVVEDFTEVGDDAVPGTTRTATSRPKTVIEARSSQCVRPAAPSCIALPVMAASNWLRAECSY